VLQRLLGLLLFLLAMSFVPCPKVPSACWPLKESGTR